MTTTAMNDSLAKAIAYLGAVEVAPGRYAWHREPEPSGWYVGPESALYVPMLSLFAKMPAWWSPEQRFAWRMPDGRVVDLATHSFSEKLGAQRITADLKTGAEVAA